MEKIVRKGSEFLGRFRKGRLRQWGMAALCLLTLLVVYMVFTSVNPGNTDGKSAGQTASPIGGDRCSDTEDRLEQILSRIEGAGEVQVMITFSTGTEIVPAMSVETQSNSSEQNAQDGSWQTTVSRNEQSSPVTSQSGNEPVVLLEKMPEILGVVVVARGAGDLTVRLALRQAVETVLQIPARKVEVFPMDSGKGGANP